jgi:hypothetical protein
VTDKPKNRFDQLHRPRTLQEQAFYNQTRFESSIINHILTKCGLGRHRSALLSESHSFGERLLTAAAFNDYFPQFPVLLGCSRLEVHVHKDPASTEPSRFKQFHKVPFVDTYYSVVESMGDAASHAPVGLVFPRKGFRYGMIMHNDDSEQGWFEGLCWVFKIPDSAAKLYVQPLDQWLDAIGTRWLES